MYLLGPVKGRGEAKRWGTLQTMIQARRSLVQPGRSLESTLPTRAVLGRCTPASLCRQTQVAPGGHDCLHLRLPRASWRLAAECCLRSHGQVAGSLSKEDPPARLLVCRGLRELRHCHLRVPCSLCWQMGRLLASAITSALLCTSGLSGHFVHGRRADSGWLVLTGPLRTCSLGASSMEGGSVW